MCRVASQYMRAAPGSLSALRGANRLRDGVRVAVADLAGTLLAETLGELDVDHYE